VFGLKHQAKQGRVLQGEADIGPGQLGQAGREVLPAILGRATQGQIEPLEAALRQGVQERLLVGKVTTGRGVTDAQFTTEFPQGNVLNAARFNRFFRRTEQLFTEISVMIGAGKGFHCQHFTRLRDKLQHVSVDNYVSTVYIPFHTHMNITNNTILITGGGSGIGRGLAEAFHALGNKVIIAGRRQHALAEVTDANPGMASVTLDIDNPEAIRSFAAEVTELHPTLNVLINNAGISRLENLKAKPEDTTNAEAMITTNLLGPIRLTAALLPHLRKQPRATIINVTSGLAFVPLPVAPIYSATKAALHSYTESLRVQFKDTPLEFLEIIPPYVQTELGGPAQAADPRAMPLKDYIAETIQILKSQPQSRENCVERVKPLRFAEATGSFDKMLQMLGQMTIDPSHP